MASTSKLAAREYFANERIEKALAEAAQLAQISLPEAPKVKKNADPFLARVTRAEYFADVLEAILGTSPNRVEDFAVLDQVEEEAQPKKATRKPRN